MEKLNLKWVTDTIGKEYKQWNKGDIVTVQAQTGTGKTFFVKNKLITEMEIYEHMLIVANRINLKRQLKKDLLKNMRKEIPKDIKELDNMTNFGNVYIMSYQQIDAFLNAKEFGQTDFNLNFYDYIICDEAHYIFCDSGFNNKTDYSFYELIRQNHTNAIKMFISATIEEIRPTIVKAFEDNNKISFGIHKNKLWDYSTGTDYSYLNTKYFKSIKDIALTIKNDKSEDKWLVFVTKKDDAKKIAEILEGNKETSIIDKNTENEDLDEIINNNKFKSQVLICTKCLDNGINIEDNNVKNIVVMAWDRITFIQELGRVRQDIENPYEIDLYIQTKSKQSFQTLIDMVYKPKQTLIDEIEGTEDGKIVEVISKEKQEELYDKFCAKYNRSYNKLSKDIFYIDKNGKWKTNLNGRVRLLKDRAFAEYMVQMFKDNKFAFVEEQLNWIGLDADYNNLIEDVIDSNDTNKLEKWLEEHIDERIFSDEQQELSDLIIKELTTIGNDVDYRTKKLKPMTIENILRVQLNLSYAIKEKGNNINPKNKKKQRWIKIGKIS
ncbi:hypothetical protein DWV12_11225 [Clostridium botulinum]|uniref:DEAD/DEAH box helicase n=1 Tax=Clostridium botulinum TaxID=1491 RepID=UPI0019682B21|nr:DEAD/DEAH box helicase family protein [Clostridium botulinum]MBN1071534.1 hypothetical protein [Clostridium botulinum]MCS6107942.1 hypothetical protein [Clostridium botulinum]